MTSSSQFGGVRPEELFEGENKACVREGQARSRKCMAVDVIAAQCTRMCVHDVCIQVCRSV